MDPELEAMQALLAALTPLEQEVRERVIRWAAGRFTLALPASRKASLESDELGYTGDEEDTVPSGGHNAKSFETLGELFSAAEPKTNGQKALVVGFWLQTMEGLSDLDSQRINTELKHLGYGVANITTAMDEIKNVKPAMAIQLKKSGTSRQARKKYKITEAGIKSVKAVLAGEDWK